MEHIFGKTGGDRLPSQRPGIYLRVRGVFVAGFELRAHQASLIDMIVQARTSLAHKHECHSHGESVTLLESLPLPYGLEKCLPKESMRGKSDSPVQDRNNCGSDSSLAT